VQTSIQFETVMVKGEELKALPPEPKASDNST
jgi:hypothetical protein